MSKSSCLLADCIKRSNKRLDICQLPLSLSYSFCHFGLLRKSVSLKPGLLLDIEKIFLFFNKINTVNKVRNPNYNKQYASTVVCNPKSSRYFRSNSEIVCKESNITES